MSIIAAQAEKCTVCNGSGQQSFHGLADSYRATCNFCGGHGTREEEVKWYDNEFKERGLGSDARTGGTSNEQ